MDREQNIKRYIIIYLPNMEGVVYAFLENEEWGNEDLPEDEDFSESKYDEFYGGYNAKIMGWTITQQNMFVVDPWEPNGTEESKRRKFTSNLKLSQKCLIKYKKFEPCVILAFTNLESWKECFDNVYVVDYPIIVEDLREIIAKCIRLYTSFRG